MAGGMKFDPDVAELDLLAIGDGLRAAGEIVAVAQPHHVERFLRGQHRAMARPGMVGMAMGDHGPLDRPHRVDMEAAGLAAQAGGNGHQDVLRTHLGYIGRSIGDFYPSCAALDPRIQSRNSCLARLFLSSGDLMADRRFDFARDLQLKGDLVAAADLLLQATELAPGFASAWFTLGEVREQLGEREAAIAAFRKARAADPDDRHGAGLRLMRLGAEPNCPACRRPMCGRCSINMRRSSRPRWSMISAIAVRRCCSRRCCRRAAPRRKPAFFKRAIDLGCGTGLAARRLRQRRSIISSASICRRA